MRNDSNLQDIHTKIDEIQIGLLRFQQEEKQVNLQVRVQCKDECMISCVINDADDAVELPTSGRVTLVQKSEKNYLYITGEVEEMPGANGNNFSIRILRACWFVLKSKGAVSWLQEKIICDLLPQESLELAS